MATIVISGPVEVRDEETQEEVTDPRRLKVLGGAQQRGVKLANDLDGELAHLGIARGDLMLEYDAKTGQVLVVSTFEAPHRLAPKQLKSLVDFARDQWSDGAGEGAFYKLMDKHRVSLDLTPSGSERETRVQQTDQGGKKLKATPELLVAAEKGDTRAIRRLLAAGGNPSTRGRQGSALHLAILNDHPAAAALLIEAGAKVNPQGKDDPPLSTAAMACDLATAQRLIAAGADVNCADPEGRTPLMWAANRACEPIVKLLLEHGADPNARDRVEGNEGLTPLKYVERRHRNIIELLIAHGAKADPPKPSAVQQALDQAALCDQSGNPTQAAHWRKLAEQLQKHVK